VQDAQRNAKSRSFPGHWKPEPLKADLSGFWSRRLSQKDRLIYSFDKKAVHIFAIGGYYDDK